MKKLTLLVSFLILNSSFFFLNCFAQSPQQFNYQGVARDNGGNVLANQNIGFQLSLHSGSVGGTVVYSETQSPTTNQFGLFNIQVGTGTVVSGNMSTVDWGGNSFFLQVEMDPTGGTVYQNMGTSQLLSVPYALYANGAANAWELTGNTGTTYGSNYIGTADGQNLMIKVNGDEAGRIEYTGTVNTSYGYQALSSNTSGNRNVANGNQALSGNIMGNYNTANGNQALFTNTSGSNNTANGNQALYLNTMGSSNTATGNQALLTNATGNGNSANGNRALYSNISGDYNTATGNQALYSNKAGFYATAIGTNAMQYTNNTTTDFDNFNVAVGCEALRGSTTASANTGNSNTALGYQTLWSNTTGNSNAASGTYSLHLNTTGSSNTANGYWALYSNTEGNFNSANGSYALSSNTTGDYNVASGYRALRANTTGSDHTATGAYALQSNTEGYENTATGSHAMYSNNTGYWNSAHGYHALYSNTSGSENAANGAFALYYNTTGNNNTANGLQALYSNTTGSQNTATGRYSLSFITTQNNNTALGFAAGDYYTFSQGTFVGINAYPNTDGYINVMGLGYNARPTASNSVRVGNGSVSSIGGQVGWTTISDGRYKTNVRDEAHGLDFILKLRPVVYNLDAWKLADRLQEDKARDKDGNIIIAQPDVETVKSRNEKAAIAYSGFIAQEVEQAAQKVGYDFSGVDAPKNENDMYGLRYAEFVVPLVKAVQEQQEMIVQLRKENELQQRQIKQLMESK